jgi:hypothetical protein
LLIEWADRVVGMNWGAALSGCGFDIAELMIGG